MSTPPSKEIIQTSKEIMQSIINIKKYSDMILSKLIKIFNEIESDFVENYINDKINKEKSKKIFYKLSKLSLFVINQYDKFIIESFSENPDLDNKCPFFSDLVKGDCFGNSGYESLFDLENQLKIEYNTYTKKYILNFF